MTRVLDFLRSRSAGLADATDRHLLGLFLTTRDERAFTELVRRHGPIVWAACRRMLADTRDAEDVFQATFLVLVRRAAAITADTPLGPWLHRVAAMIARNVVRGNRRRAVVSGPMEHDVHAPGEPAIDRLDLDAALCELPEKYRVAVVLCHLQGLTRREAAAQLGCPEGTLSARLNRAMSRLRQRLGASGPVVLVGGATMVPAEVSAGVVRAATVYATSTLTTAGVSPAVAGLIREGLRMFWMTKLIRVAALAVVAGGGMLALSLAGWSAGATAAADPPAAEAKALPADPAAAAKQVDEQLAELAKQKAELDRKVAEAQAKKEQLERAVRELAEAKELGSSVSVVVTDRAPGQGKPLYTVREVVGGKIGEMKCNDLAMLTTYLTRAFNDPKGPKTLRIHAHQPASHEQIRPVCAACAAAGYKTASFFQSDLGGVRYTTTFTRTLPTPAANYVKLPAATTQPIEKKTEIDLTKFTDVDPTKKP